MMKTKKDSETEHNFLITLPSQKACPCAAKSGRREGALEEDEELERGEKKKSNTKVQGGMEGGRSQGGAWSRRSQMLVQRPAMTRPQGGVEARRSHAGDMTGTRLGTVMETPLEMETQGLWAGLSSQVPLCP